MAVLTNTMLQGTAADTGDGDGYQIEKSLRFNEADSPSLERYISKSGNRNKWTWSGWVKRSSLSTTQAVFYCGTDGNNREGLLFLNDNTMAVAWRSGGTTNEQITSAGMFRDPSAWLHVVWAFDYNISGTSPTGKSKFYINGKLIPNYDVNGNAFSNAVVRKMNEAANTFYIGKQPAGDKANLLLADVHFIDGLALSPAAFGEFDSNTGVWNPKAFALPAPNTGVTWSSYGDSNDETARPWSRGFDGIFTADSTADQYTRTANTSTAAVWTVPGSGLAFNTLRILGCRDGSNDGNQIVVNGITTTGFNTSNTHNWNDISSQVSSPLKTITLDPDGGQPRFMAIEVDGVVLVDGQTDPTTRNNVNNGTTWSSSLALSAGSFHNSHPATSAFDGSLTTGSAPAAYNGTHQTLTFSPALSGSHKIRVYAADGDSNTVSVYVNGSDTNKNLPSTQANIEWVDLGSHSNVSTIKLHCDNASAISYLRAIEIDGHILIDSSVDNSFHLKFNDTSTNKSLGYDSLGTTDYSAANSTSDKGEPILKTNKQGDTIVAGYRTDSNAAHLKLAIPGNVCASGTAGTDQSDHVTNSSSSEKNFQFASTPTVTDSGKYYGKSIKFDGTDDALFVSDHADWTFGDSNFCIEGWFYVDSSSSGVTANDWAPLIFRGHSTNNNVFDWRLYWGTSGGYRQVFFDCTFDGTEKYIGDTVQNVHDFEFDTWFHVAATRHGSTVRLYINGKYTDKETSISGDMDDDWNDLIMGREKIANNQRYFKGQLSDIRVYKGTSKYGDTDNDFLIPQRTDFTVNNLTGDNDVPSAATVANATGALPFYNTSGDYGTTQESGERADSSAGTTDGTGLIYALGDGTSDVHASVNTGSANKSLTVNGVTTTSSNTKFYGTAITFDGSNDYLHYANGSTDLTDFDLVGGDFTLEAWVKSSTSTQQAILNKFDNASHWHWNWHLLNGGHKFQYSDSNGNGSPASYTVSSTIINVCDGEWHHLAVVRKSGTIYLFTDGFLGKAESGHNRTISSGDKYISVGRDDSNSGRYYFNGQMTDVRVYKGVAKYDKTFNVPSATAISVSSFIDTLVDSPSSFGTDTGAGGELSTNYPTMNPLDNGGALTLTEGNLQAYDGNADHNACRATFKFPSSGKWYYEARVDILAGANCVGAATDAIGNPNLTSAGTYYILLNSSGNVQRYTAGSHEATYSGTTTPAVGSIFQVAYDADAGKLWVGFDNQWMDNSTGKTGNPATGANATWSSVTNIFPATNQASSKASFNFGQRAFEKTVPSGFLPLCSANIPDTFSGNQLNKPSSYFDVKLWEGNSTNNHHVVSDAKFKPDLIVIKNRDYTDGAVWHDSARGMTTQTMYSHLADGQYNQTNRITDYDDTGFKVGWPSADDVNESGQSYVSWFWDAGATAATASTDGSVTPSAQWVNATAGFSISTWAGNDTNPYTIGHGLSAKPDFIILRRYTTGSSGWFVYHSSRGAEKYIQLDDNGAEGDDTGFFNDTEPSNTIFTLGSWNGWDSGNSLIAYCWTAIPGYSAFGKYTGNGNADGPFFYTGFKPRWFLMKELDDATNWLVYDSERDVGNPAQFYLFPNDSAGGNTYDAANTSLPVDFLSNGFKMRNNNSGLNADGDTYIWAAFAEHPFKTARAV